MDTWGILGVFLLGAGAGALLTAIYYAAQIRGLRQVLNTASAQDFRVGQENQEFEGRKSA